MKSKGNRVKVATVDRAAPAAVNGIVLNGTLFEVGQDHLLEPFVRVLESVEQMATVAASGCSASNEKACVEGLYRSLYHFFGTLLPSASHQVVDRLTYSVALLLAGEAIEASRIVAEGPTRPGDPLTGPCARGVERQEAPGRSGR